MSSDPLVVYAFHHEFGKYIRFGLSGRGRRVVEVARNAASTKIASITLLSN